MKIICTRCGSEKEAKHTEDIYKDTDHLKCDWCENCERHGDDYWEYYCCNVEGEAINE